MPPLLDAPTCWLPQVAKKLYTLLQAACLRGNHRHSTDFLTSKSTAATEMFFKYRTHAVAKRHRCVMLAANLRPDLHSYIRQSPLKPRPEPLVRPPRLAPADAGGAHSRWMTTNMTDIKSEEDAVQPKEQTYAAAPQWRRICAGFIDTITVGGIAACIAEHWIATYNAGAETLPAVFATLWVLRDQLPSTSSQNHPR
eukprot:SAG31_NODE_585_length_13845_cov_25.623163_4_plen_197_part_00